MEHSTTQMIKQMLVSMTGLSKDALHVHVGLATMFATAMISCKEFRSLLPWLAVFAAALCGEMLDMYDDLISPGILAVGNECA